MLYSFNLILHHKHQKVKHKYPTNMIIATSALVEDKPRPYGMQPISKGAIKAKGVFAA